MTTPTPDATRRPFPYPRTDSVDAGVAGRSAQTEFERRSRKRAEKIREDHPKLGGLILALSEDPQSTGAWASGAVGERLLAAQIDKLGNTVIALHDRKVPRSRANIDHIVVGPSGVFVVDTKRCQNATIGIRRSGWLFSRVREQLMVGGRDNTKLVEGMQWQVDVVRAVLANAFRDLPVIAALCFVDAKFPMFETLRMNDVEIKAPKGIAKLVSRDGPFDATARDRLARHLAARLPAATR